MIKRTSDNLVKFVSECVGRGYWFGTFGNLANDNLYQVKKAQYPTYYQFSYDSYKKDFGTRVCDCAGLLKWFLWARSFDDKTPTYNASEDYGATGFYNKCTVKGSLKDYKALTPGMIVFKGNDTTKTHMGIYIGNNKIIEAKNHNNGVIKSDINSSWNYYGKCHLIEYSDITPIVTDKEINVQTYQIKKGSICTAVSTIQVLLNYLGYKGTDGKPLTVDGEFGPHTDNAVRTFQRTKKLEIDGIVGPLTWKALLNG